jgi:hypothetical protein
MDCFSVLPLGTWRDCMKALKVFHFRRSDHSTTTSGQTTLSLRPISDKLARRSIVEPTKALFHKLDWLAMNFKSRPCMSGDDTLHLTHCKAVSRLLLATRSLLPRRQYRNTAHHCAIDTLSCLSLCLYFYLLTQFKSLNWRHLILLIWHIHEILTTPFREATV